MADTGVIFKAATRGGTLRVHVSPRHDGAGFEITGEAEAGFVVLGADDVQRLWLALATTGAQTRTEWAARFTFTEEHGGHTEIRTGHGEHDAIRSYNQLARSNRIERAELVCRDVHTLDDGTVITRPWTVADTSSKEA